MFWHVTRPDLMEHHVLDFSPPLYCKIGSKSPAHILECHLWNSLVNKSILSFIPLCGSLLCRSWWSKLVVNDHQQDPPHLALCSSRVKVRTKVAWHLHDWTSCTKVIPYLAFVCELGCVYLDVSNCWRKKLTYPQFHPAMLPNLGGFARIFTRKGVHGLTLLYRSLNVTHTYFLTRACLYS